MAPTSCRAIRLYLFFAVLSPPLGDRGAKKRIPLLSLSHAHTTVMLTLVRRWTLIVRRVKRHRQTS